MWGWGARGKCSARGEYKRITGSNLVRNDNQQLERQKELCSKNRKDSLLESEHQNRHKNMTFRSQLFSEYYLNMSETYCDIIRKVPEH